MINQADDLIKAAEKNIVKPCGLYQKIHAVMAGIDYIKKDIKIEYNNTKYSAVSEEEMTLAVREQLIKNRLIVLPVKQDHVKEGSLTTVNVTYQIIDIDTGEKIEVVSSGTGVDTQDKGVGKAMTYSYKYLFRRCFAIPTGDDPDYKCNEEIEDSIKFDYESKANTENISMALAKFKELFLPIRDSLEKSDFDWIKSIDINKKYTNAEFEELKKTFEVLKKTYSKQLKK